VHEKSGVIKTEALLLGSHHGEESFCEFPAGYANSAYRYATHDQEYLSALNSDMCVQLIMRNAP